MFTTGDGLLKQVDSVTEDGLQNIFATNLFGHFTLVRAILLSYWLSLSLSFMRNEPKANLTVVSKLARISFRFASYKTSWANLDHLLK